MAEADTTEKEPLSSSITSEEKKEENVSERPLDIVVYGATGFTGTFIAKQLCRKMLRNHPFLRMGIGGRSLSKLDTLLTDELVPLGETTEEKQKIRDITILVADATNESELREVVRRTKLIVSAVGPFRFYGEKVIKCCAELGTHYVDICGEPEFMEKCAFKYFDTAVANGAVIVSACGFDSVPSDIGQDFVSSWFRDNGGLCSSMDCYVTSRCPNGYSAHVTTFQAAVHGYASVGDLKEVRNQLKSVEWRHGRRDIARAGAKQKIHKETYFWSDDLEKYSMLFPFADSAVVSNSQGIRSALLMAQQQKKTIFPQFACYMSFHTFGQICQAISIGGVGTLLTKYEFGRQLLLNYPSLFTMGTFSEEGPSAQQIETTTFASHFYAHGYSPQKLSQLRQQTESKSDENDHDLSTLTATAKPDIKVHCVVSGPDAAYAGTAIMITECALCLLEEIDTIKTGDLSKGVPAIVGGVFTPSTVFGGTNLVERLNGSGISVTIDVLEGSDLLSTEDDSEAVYAPDVDQNADEAALMDNTVDLNDINVKAVSDKDEDEDDMGVLVEASDAVPPS